ncbi:DUF4375 domain-containing protein [Caenimonas sedimenti]|uniref:DUF4375 domain-containing protein n=1 Tax=Caenimonas sedimenti TaxID=2596921 RepID=A0A562ZV06_9BURK|nr:DUF4375 domain-containing protein [Caenimonas sedimenti]TWO72168.1 DUF4375 domain-containing protein [Caenimonas sedimenti]
MDDLDFVLETIDPWLSKYINGGAASLEPIELLAVGVWMLDAEVNNGGFHQYYSNTRGELAVATVGALRAIGAVGAASLLEAANECIPSFPLPEDREARLALLEEVENRYPFQPLETEFYEEREDRIALLASYLKEAQ